MLQKAGTLPFQLDIFIVAPVHHFWLYKSWWWKLSPSPPCTNQLNCQCRVTWRENTVGPNSLTMILMRKTWEEFLPLLSLFLILLASGSAVVFSLHSQAIWPPCSALRMHHTNAISQAWLCSLANRPRRPLFQEKWKVGDTWGPNAGKLLTSAADLVFCPVP